jgi:hypothetical protein
MSPFLPRRLLVLTFVAHPDDESLGPAANTEDMGIPDAVRSNMDEPAGHALYAASPRSPEGSA